MFDSKIKITDIIRFEAGPAAAVSAIPALGFLKLRGFTGTAFA